VPLLTVLYTLQQEGGTGSAALWGVQVSLQSPTTFILYCTYSDSTHEGCVRKA
jgi:hypothetical protein